MNTINYFKLQAKNLFKDYKTKTIHDYLSGYTPKYFDVDGIICDFDLDERDFTLMNAQHIVAQLCGFEKWTALLKASASELELAKLLFDHQNIAHVDSWMDYITYAQEMNQTTFETETKIEIFKQVILTRQVVLDAVPGYLLKQESPSQR